MTQRPPRRTRWAWLTVSGVAVLAGMYGLTSPSESAWSTAQVTNTSGTAATGALAFRHEGTAGCAAGPGVTTTTTCPGSIVPTSPTSQGAPVTGSDAITNTGTLGPDGIIQSIQAESCAPVEFANARAPGDPMLARYSTAFQRPDPWGTTSAVTLSGRAYAADVQRTNVGALLGSTFATGVWFKVADGYSEGGGLISLASGPADERSTRPAVALWMADSGKIHYYLAGTLGTSSTGVSSAAYNDGEWHFAALSVSSLLLTRPTLYVDGTATTGLGLTLLTGASGYWHAGWLDTTGLGSAPSSPAVTGSLSGAFVTGTSISQSTVNRLRRTSTAEAFQQAVLGLSGIVDLWMLDDPGTTTFTGALPATMDNPCARVNIGFTFVNPADSIPTQTLAAFADGTPGTVDVPGPGTTQTMTVRLTRNDNYNTAIAGLHLYAPLRITEKTTGSTWSLMFQWPAAGGTFLA